MDGHKNSIANRRKTLENFRKNGESSLERRSLQRDLGKSNDPRERIKLPNTIINQRVTLRVPYDKTRSAVEGEVENTRI